MNAELTNPATNVAIVTGGSRGIGRRIAETLSHHGYALVIGYGRDAAAAQELVDELASLGGGATAVGGDIGDENYTTALFTAAENTFGGVDVVVHAAAILPMKPLVDFSTEDLDGVLRTNVRGTQLLNREAARSVRPGGSIVNLSSAGTRTLVPGYGPYAASKAALEALVPVLARELAGRDITVNAVAPGPTESDMLEANLADSGDAEGFRERLVEMVPLGRLGRPDDIASVVLSLVTTARWVNGQTVHANGGLT